MQLLCITDSGCWSKGHKYLGLACILVGLLAQGLVFKFYSGMWQR